MTDDVYTERNRVVAAFAQLAKHQGYAVGLKPTNIDGWDPEWHGCVYINLPTGQVSWHYHDNDAFLFAGLESYLAEYDGHTTAEKYQRLEEYARLLREPSVMTDFSTDLNGNTTAEKYKMLAEKYQRLEEYGEPDENQLNDIHRAMV